jgi:alcohol dehydrogenase
MKGTSSPTSTSNGHSPSHLPPFDFQPLGRVIHEAGALNRLGELTASLGIARPLLVTDPGLASVGHPQRAMKILSEAGLQVSLFDRVQENPTERQVIEGVAFARAANIDGIVAIGGGSSMDCAKGINFLLTNGGRMADYRGHGKATKPMLPSVGVPTTSGTGSEAQSYALITDETTHMKMACGDKKAAFRISILDPELTLSQPQKVTAVTGIDAVAHALESYVCTKRNTISNLAARGAWKELATHFGEVLTNPQNLTARAGMQVGSYLAGMAIENAMLGVCHSCANPLTAHYGLTHGVAIGVMLPHVVRFNAAQVGAWYAELLAETHPLAVDEPGENMARIVTGMVRTAGLPTTLKECGVSQSILPLLAEEANQQWTARFNPRIVGEAEILSLYQAAW